MIRRNHLRDPELFDPAQLESPTERVARQWRERDHRRRYLTPGQRMMLLGDSSSDAAILALGPAGWWTPRLSAMWTDSARTIRAVLDADVIGACDDYSGNGNNVLQATAGNKPALKLNIINGKPVMRFTAAVNAAAGADFLTLSAGLAVGRPANYTVFLVGMATDVTVANSYCAALPSDGANANAWGTVRNKITVNGALVFSHGDGTNGRYGEGNTDALVNSTFKLMTVSFTAGSTNADLWVGSTAQTIQGAVGTATACTGTVQPWSLGRSGAYDGAYLGGDIAEVIVFGKALSAGDRQTVWNRLNNVYAL